MDVKCLQQRVKCQFKDLNLNIIFYLLQTFKICYRYMSTTSKFRCQLYKRPDGLVVRCLCFINFYVLFFISNTIVRNLDPSYPCFPLPNLSSIPSLINISWQVFPMHQWEILHFEILNEIGNIFLSKNIISSYSSYLFIDFTNTFSASIFCAY